MTDTAPLNEIALKRGGSVRLLSATLEHASLEAAFASPPGSTVDLVLANAPLGLKVQGCRRVGPEEPARFRIEGRWVNLTKPQRELLRLQVRSQVG